MFATARELATWMYQGGFLLAAALSAALIAAVSRAPTSVLGRVLSWRPLVAVGVVSYGLYLWHWPVYVALDHERTGLGGPTLLAARIGVTRAAGGPVVHAARGTDPHAASPASASRPTGWGRAVAAATAAVVALTLGATASAVPAGLAPAREVAGARPSPVPDAQGRLVDAFLLGDSQSYGLRVYYGNQVRGLAVNGSTQLGCGTLLPERHVDGQTVPNIPACAEWEPRWTQEIEREKPDLVVLMLGLGELYDRLVDDRVVRFGTTDYRDWLYSEIDRRREVVEGNDSRLVLTTVLCMRISADAADVNAQVANDPERLEWLNDTIRGYGSAHDVGVVDLHGTVCSDGYQERVDGVDLRDDGLHLNQGGASLVWGQLGPALVREARRS